MGAKKKGKMDGKHAMESLTMRNWEVKQASWKTKEVGE